MKTLKEIRKIYKDLDKECDKISLSDSHGIICKVQLNGDLYFRRAIIDYEDVKRLKDFLTELVVE